MGGNITSDKGSREQVRLVIPRLTPSLNEYLGMHWIDKNKLMKTWHWEVRAAMKETYEEIRFDHPKRKVKIISFRKRLCDPDNLAGGFKPLIDALVLNNLLIDDADKFMILEPCQEKDRKSPRTEVIITEVKE